MTINTMTVRQWKITVVSITILVGTLCWYGGYHHGQRALKAEIKQGMDEIGKQFKADVVKSRQRSQDLLDEEMAKLRQVKARATTNPEESRPRKINGIWYHPDGTPVWGPITSQPKK